MNSNNIKRNRDGSLFNPEGYFELYTPIAGPIVSPALEKVLKHARICLSEDANVTFKDAKGNQVTAFPLTKGLQPFLVTEVSAVSAGVVAIVHEGLIDSGTQNEE